MSASPTPSTGGGPCRSIAPRGSLLTRAARRDLYQDDVNHVVLVRGGEHLTRSLVYVDHTLVDGVVNGTAASMGGLSSRMRRLQNGFARSYAVSMFGGAAVLIAATLLMRGCDRDVLPPDGDGGRARSRCDRHRRRAGAARRTAAKWVALAFSLATLALAATVFARFDPGGARYQLTESHAWIPTSGCGTNWASTASGWRSSRCTAVLVPFVILAGWHDADHLAASGGGSAAGQSKRWRPTRASSP